MGDLDVVACAARERLRTGEAGTARSKAARRSVALSNIMSNLVQSSSAACDKVQARDAQMQGTLGLSEYRFYCVSPSTTAMQTIDYSRLSTHLQRLAIRNLSDRPELWHQQPVTAN